jgi:DNA-directed RNA polymerase specialized sigma24 family protein
LKPTAPACARWPTACSVHEAEDVVQDAWLRWQAADQAQVQDPLA